MYVCGSGYMQHERRALLSISCDDCDEEPDRSRRILRQRSRSRYMLLLQLQIVMVDGEEVLFQPPNPMLQPRGINSAYGWLIRN